MEGGRNEIIRLARRESTGTLTFNGLATERDEQGKLDYVFFFSDIPSENELIEDYRRVND